MHLISCLNCRGGYSVLTNQTHTLAQRYNSCELSRLGNNTVTVTFMLLSDSSAEDQSTDTVCLMSFRSYCRVLLNRWSLQSYRFQSEHLSHTCIVHNRIHCLMFQCHISHIECTPCKDRSIPTILSCAGYLSN